MHFGKKSKMRNVVYLAILSICISEIIFLPLIVDGQRNSGDIEITTESINDLNVRKKILRKKGIFFDVGDSHWFKIDLKQGVEYVARMKITAAYGGQFFIALYGVSTSEFYNEIFSTPITNYMIETIYIADGTTTGTLQVFYSTAVLNQEFPTYTLYFNKTGFAGWWWIILLGIGILAIVAFLFTFAIIGIKSVSKRKKTKRKKKKKHKR